MKYGNIYTKKIEDGIAFCVINNPAKKNAMDGRDAFNLATALRDLEFDSDVRVVILRGEGTTFSAGGNLGSWISEVEGNRAALRNFGESVRQMNQMEKPIVCMVDGWAVGGGFGYVLNSDFVIASERTKLSCPFVNIGIAPELGSMKLLPMYVGPQKAKEIFFFGQPISAEEALAYGFVNKVVPPEELEATTIEFAKKVSALPTLATRITKRLTNVFFSADLNICLEAEAQNTPCCAQTEDNKSRIAVFTKK